VFADLSQRCLDAAFDEQFPENGNFNLITVKGRDYWYYNGYDAVTGRKTKKYVGPAADPAIAARVQEFNRIKVAFRARLEAVRMLRSAGFPSPDAMTGALVDRLAKAGFFRLRGVLVGTVAFQAYPGLVGARPDRHLQTGDVDLAQDHGIAVAIGEAMSPVLDEIKAVDGTFREVPHALDSRFSTTFMNAKGFKVEFLVPNRGSEDHMGKPTPMPTLGGVAAQPLRFLDFLIKNPVRSVLLHGGGVAVTVPAPERYALHKMIVSTRRRDDAKATKDLGQAAFLIEAMTPLHAVELVDVWAEAWDRGAKWRTCLLRAKSRLPVEIRQRIDSAIVSCCADFDRTPASLGVAPLDSASPADLAS
jgi:hypothetical protein